MKAISYSQYGPPAVLQLKELETPQPRDHEMLIKIKATAVNVADRRLRAADPFGVRLFFGLMKPKKHILGGVLSGIVEQVGKNVSMFKAGDEVFGSTGMGFGAYAAYKCLPESGTLAKKPANLSHEEAAVIPFGGITALHFLRKADIKPGQQVLIAGASGSVGTAAVQLAKYFGAEVTAICSASNAGLVKSLGADRIFDYTREDITKVGATYDVIFDTLGKVAVADLLKLLRKTGTLLLGATSIAGTLLGLWTSMSSSKKVVSGLARERAESLAFLKDLAEAGKLKAVIDRTYVLEQMVEAHEYVELGHKKGNVAIIVG